MQSVVNISLQHSTNDLIKLTARGWVQSTSMDAELKREANYWLPSLWVKHRMPIKHSSRNSGSLIKVELADVSEIVSDGFCPFTAWFVPIKKQLFVLNEKLFMSFIVATSITVFIGQCK